MNQPFDPNEGQYRPGAPKPPGPQDLAAGQPPARPDLEPRAQFGGGPSPGVPAPHMQDDWDQQPQGTRLGRLSQAARDAQLSQARWRLIISGALTLGLSGYFVATARSQVDAEIRRLQQQAGPGMFRVDQTEVDRAVQL